MSLDYSRNELVAEDIAVVKVPADRLEPVWRYAYPFITIGSSDAPDLRIRDVIDGGEGDERKREGDERC